MAVVTASASRGSVSSGIARSVGSASLPVAATFALPERSGEVVGTSGPLAVAGVLIAQTLYVVAGEGVGRPPAVGGLSGSSGHPGVVPAWHLGVLRSGASVVVVW